MRHDRRRRSPTVITWASNHKRRNADVCVGSSSPSLSWMIFLVIALSNFVVKQPECVPSELGETIGPLLQIKGLQASVEKRFAVDIHVQLSKAHTHKRQCLNQALVPHVLNLYSTSLANNKKTKRLTQRSSCAHSRFPAARSAGLTRLRATAPTRCTAAGLGHAVYLRISLSTRCSQPCTGASLKECGDGLGLMFHLFLGDLVAPGANERHRRCAPCEVLGSNPQTALGQLDTNLGPPADPPTTRAVTCRARRTTGQGVS